VAKFYRSQPQRRQPKAGIGLAGSAEASGQA
jgi:hypothetical protein